MEKLIELLNQYEDSRWEAIYIEDEDGIDYEEKPTRREVDGHIWHCNASTVAFEKDTFDSYVLSKQYKFIKWLVKNEKVKPLRKFIGWETDEDEPYIQFDLVDQYIAYLSSQDEPIQTLISILK